MGNLCIIGYPGSGKTTVALGLALKLKNEGKKVAYFKPVGILPVQVSQREVDEARLMKEVLGMSALPEEIAMYRFDRSYLGWDRKQYTLKALLDTFTRITRGADVSIIEGGSFPYMMNSWGLDDISLARQFKAGIIITVKLENDFDIDRTIFINEYVTAKNVPLVGNIFNNVPHGLVGRATSLYSSILEDKGFKALGVIPGRREISSPTVDDFQKELGAEILTGQDKLHLLVEDIVVGAMSVDSALKYLRKSNDKAVIIGGDRSDLAIAALETSTSVLILTGGIHPDKNVLARARGKGIPVLLTQQDTYHTVENLSAVKRHIHAGDKAGMRVVLENIEEYCRWQMIKDFLESRN